MAMRKYILLSMVRNLQEIITNIEHGGDHTQLFVIIEQGSSRRATYHYVHMAINSQSSSASVKRDERGFGYLVL